MDVLNFGMAGAKRGCAGVAKTHVVDVQHDGRVLREVRLA
jgi:hypothetical protein